MGAKTSLLHSWRIARFRYRKDYEFIKHDLGPRAGLFKIPSRAFELKDLNLSFDPSGMMMPRCFLTKVLMLRGTIR